jgi:2-dehydro-3-deoxyphosphogluconate aldolase/(4S)-4-hydroxy-2-oxoglutarate aldolase
MMTNIVARLAQTKVIPIATAGLDATNADAVGDALIAGGLPVIEVTLRTPGAIGVVAKLAKRADLLVSTGTVLTLDQARASLDAGAHYMVAPGLDMKLVEWAQAHQLPLVPGATTATEVTQAYSAGLRMLKFFPSEAAGGVTAMKLLSGPFAGVKFIPTGGITFEMLERYLACSAILAVGQGSILKAEAIAQGRFDEIEAAARRAALLVASLQKNS